MTEWRELCAGPEAPLVPLKGNGNTYRMGGFIAVFGCTVRCGLWRSVWDGSCVCVSVCVCVCVCVCVWYGMDGWVCVCVDGRMDGWMVCVCVIDGPQIDPPTQSINQSTHPPTHQPTNHSCDRSTAAAAEDPGHPFMPAELGLGITTSE